MKTLRSVLLLTPVLLVAMTRLAAAGPAMVVMFPEDGTCVFGWEGIEADALPHLILLPGQGVLVQSDNSRGNASLHCGGRIDFGATTVAVDFETGMPVLVQLLTLDEVCTLINPALCRGGGNGAAIANFENTGLECVVGATGTTQWSERVAPSGQVQISCHLPS